MKNIKKISELGLELIELEDQVLLVDKKSKAGEFYYVDNSLGKRIERAETRPSGDVFEIIASTEPLEGLPLLVIEDEAMINALNVIEESKIENKSTQIITIGAYVTGYNKAKETYKFTEEDLVKVVINSIQFGQGLQEPQNESGAKKQDKKINKFIDDQIKSLTKKEFYISCFDNGKIKIDNNKIFGLWK